MNNKVLSYFQHCCQKTFEKICILFQFIQKNDHSYKDSKNHFSQENKVVKKRVTYNGYFI